MMPVMDGVSVLAAARREKISTPVLLLTAKAEIDDKVAGLDAGANDYLTKPFDMRELLARLRGDCRDGSVPGSNVLPGGHALGEKPAAAKGIHHICQPCAENTGDGDPGGCTDAGSRGRRE